MSKAMSGTDLAKRRDPYIIQARDGDKYTKYGIYEVWRDAVIAAGCKGITTRHVRPYALSVMEATGYGIREIQKVAVHTPVTTTEGYRCDLSAQTGGRQTAWWRWLNSTKLVE